LHFYSLSSILRTGLAIADVHTPKSRAISASRIPYCRLNLQAIFDRRVSRGTPLNNSVTCLEEHPSNFRCCLAWLTLSPLLQADGKRKKWLCTASKGEGETPVGRITHTRLLRFRIRLFASQYFHDVVL
jgi:hypothetical protein